MADSPVKADDGPRRKAGYKSWKKKYRKMRIRFEQKMHVGEEIFKQEAKASATVKRIAEENDRLLDILLDINNCPQIPLEKRIDVALQRTSSQPSLPIDLDSEPIKTDDAPSGMHRLHDLLADVPHMNYTTAKETNPILIRDTERTKNDSSNNHNNISVTGTMTTAKDANELSYPSHFLSPDDVDNYIYMIDSKLDPDTHIPTLAPLAHPNDHPPLHPLLRNPNSSTSWLRRHAPQIFLQGNEGESHADGAAEEDGHGHGNHHATSGRKSRGGGRGGERGGRPSTRGKRGSAAARSTPAERERKSHDRDVDVSMDDDGDFRSTPVPKGKRKRDDDPGYRPKGGSGSRPSKKKRKSEGGEGTPTGLKKGKKDTPVSGKSD